MLNLFQHLVRFCSPQRLLGDPPEAGIRLSAENKFGMTIDEQSVMCSLFHSSVDYMLQYSIETLSK
jgi:hypothetical protein